MPSVFSPLNIDRLRRAYLRSTRGLSLVELMVTVAIAAVLLAVAAPNLMGTGDAKSSESAARKLGADAQYARAEAVRRAKPVLLCARTSTSTNTCTTSPSTTAWATNGWLVCYDLAGDGACDTTNTTADPNPMRVQDALKTGVTFTGPGSTVIFSATGSTAAAVTFTATKGKSKIYTWVTSITASGTIIVRQTSGS